MVLRELITKLGYNVDNTNLKVYNTQLKQASKTAMDYGRQMQSLGLKMSVAFTAPIALATRQMVKSASDAQETDSKFNAVFSNIQKKSTETSEKLAEDFGLANSSAQGFLGDTADMLTGFGFGQDEALGISDQVQRLALDLASFQNLEGGAPRASKALTVGLLGERESMKSLGIAIHEKDVKARIALMATKGQTFATERQAKAVATLQLAMEQSKNAIGDVKRTWNDYANVERRWGETRKKMWEEYGKTLLPIAKKILIFGIKVVEWMTDLNKETKRFILIVGGLTAVMGPVLLILGTMLTLFSGLTTTISGGSGIIAGMKMLGIVTKGAILPFIQLAAVVGVIYLVIREIQGWLNGDESLLGEFLDAEQYKKDWSDLMDFFKNSGEVTGKEWGKFFLRGIGGTIWELLKIFLINPIKEMGKFSPSSFKARSDAKKRARQVVSGGETIARGVAEASSPNFESAGSSMARSKEAFAEGMRQMNLAQSRALSASSNNTFNIYESDNPEDTVKAVVSIISKENDKLANMERFVTPQHRIDEGFEF